MHFLRQDNLLLLMGYEYFIPFPYNMLGNSMEIFWNYTVKAVLVCDFNRTRVLDMIIAFSFMVKLAVTAAAVVAVVVIVVAITATAAKRKSYLICILRFISC